MKLTDIRIDGFGVWSGLHLDQIRPGLNVFYGTNESGKSTVLEFLRSVFYGYSKVRREYLPPKYGGTAGGSVAALSPLGKFEIRRTDNGTSAGSLVLSGRLPLEEMPSGEDPTQSLRAVLGDVPEMVFNHVFAFGLEELQEVCALSDREVSRRLYDLSTGLDVSLSDVLSHLAERREELLKADGHCEISHLLTQQAELKAEIENLSSQNRRYARLVRDRDEAKSTVKRLETTIDDLQQQFALTQIGITAGGYWNQRSNLQMRIDALGDVPEIPENLPQKLEIVNSRIRGRRKRMTDLRTQAGEVRAEMENLGIKDSLWLQAPRVTALVDNREWIEGLEKKARLLGEDVSILEKKINAEYEETGMGQQRAADLERFRTAVLSRLASPGTSLRNAERRLEKIQASAKAAEQDAQFALKKMEAGFTSQNTTGTDLASRVKQTQERVALLRRRVELDEHLERLEDNAREVGNQGQDLVDEQTLSGRALTWLGFAFIFGTTVALAGIMLPQLANTPTGWTMAFFGVLGVILAVGAKSMLERSAELRLAECEDRIDQLRPQIEKARKEQEELDRRLPGGGGIPTMRLQAAQDELSQLQSLAPLETTRDSAESRVLAAEADLEHANREVARCRERWQRALKDARLPEKLKPHDIRRLNESCHRLQEWQLQLERRREELRDTQQSRDNFSDRMRQLLEDLHLPYHEGKAADQLRALGQELTHQEGLIRRREALQVKLKQMRRRYDLLKQQVRKLVRIRRALLMSVRARNEAEFKLRLQQRDQLRELRAAVATVDEAIGHILAGQFAEKVVRELLASKHGQDLPGYLRFTQQELEKTEQELIEKDETLTRLELEISELAKDRRLPEKQIQLAVVQERYKQAVERWQVLAATSFMLDCIRTVYEADRQPETLRDASVYFQKMSEGKYRRVWTPLGQNVLKVDDDAGNHLEIEDLSRGTREQLFFSLRLSLANSFAKRGVVLPLMLDDVLVNFDDERVSGAARLLQEYGERGRQVLVFTCHKHIAAAFQGEGIDVRKLPSHADVAQGLGRAETAVFDEAKLELPAPPAPEPEPQPEPEPVVELPPAPKPRIRTPMVVIRVEAEPANGKNRISAMHAPLVGVGAAEAHPWETWNQATQSQADQNGDRDRLASAGERGA